MAKNGFSYTNTILATVYFHFTRKCHPQLPSQWLWYPHGNKSLDLLCAEHVDAAAELQEMILPQPLLHLLHALTQTHRLNVWTRFDSDSSGLTDKWFI